jgi:hypothetical protein
MCLSSRERRSATCEAAGQTYPQTIAPPPLGRSVPWPDRYIRRGTRYAGSRPKTFLPPFGRKLKALARSANALRPKIEAIGTGAATADAIAFVILCDFCHRVCPPIERQEVEEGERHFGGCLLNPAPIAQP